MTRIYLETGARWTFACAVDHPGWCRRGKGEEAAIEALLAYGTRYAEVVGHDVPADEVEVIGRVGGDATTDFGAPAAVGEWDIDEPDATERADHLRVLDRCWGYFDAVVRSAPAELRKGPRGGGRDRDKVADHVREAERAYGRKAGVAVPPRIPWPQQREMLRAALPDDTTERTWPTRYAVRRIAWHVLDHAWEIQDRRQ